MTALHDSRVWKAYYAALEALVRPIRAADLPADLSPVRALMAGLDVPARLPPIVMIAGSVGKGTLAHALAEVLRAAGRRTGLYTSPHLHSFRERFSIDGVMIEPEDFARHAARAADAARKAGLLPSTFELATALAADWFAAQQVDIAVCEIGLGGRFDAVNALGPATLALITPLEMEHAAMLGGTLERIAWHKAGIFPAGGLAISIEQPDAAARVLAGEAQQVGCTLLWARDTAEQLALAARHLGIMLTDGEARTALAAPLPARLETVLHGDSVLVIDGSHTPRGVARLASHVELLAEHHAPVRVLVAPLGDKPLVPLLASLDRPGWQVMVAPAPRAHRSPEFAALNVSMAHASIHVMEHVDEAFASIKQHHDGLNIICGSLTTAAEGRAAFGLLSPALYDEHLRTKALFAGNRYTGKMLQSPNFRE
jgi:dihydrofolate synthase / folylpolyglutamate synthase